MTLSELVHRVQALCEIGGWTNVGVAIDYPRLVNEGLRAFTEISQHNVEEVSVTTVAGTKTYQLTSLTDATDPSWINLFDDAYYDTSTRIYKITEARLRNTARDWRSAGNGTPLYWWMPKTDFVQIYPPPSGVVTINFRGSRHEPTLISSTQSPLCPQRFHEAIANLAAYHHGVLYARGDDKVVNDSYRAYGEEMAMRLKEQLFEEDAGVIYRMTEKRVPSYEYLGTQPPVR